MSMKVLSLIPPMTQLNTPYPSTAYLTGFLRSRSIDAVQEDLALALVLGFFTAKGLQEIHAEALKFDITCAAFAFCDAVFVAICIIVLIKVIRLI